MEDFSEVNFLVGVNGSGKSRLLNTIGQRYVKRNKNVIAISNTVFDKFRLCCTKLFLRASLAI